MGMGNPPYYIKLFANHYVNVPDLYMALKETINNNGFRTHKSFTSFKVYKSISHNLENYKIINCIVFSIILLNYLVFIS